MILPTNTSRNHVHDFVQRWGSHASIPLLERACTVFVDPSIEGAIGYYNAQSSAIVFGDPLCKPSEQAALSSAFRAYCAQNKKNVTYLNASESFAQIFLQHHRGSLIGMGNEFIIDPSNDMRKKTGFYARDLRWKYNKSLREGISVHEYTGHDVHIESAMEDLGRQWLAQRKGRQACLFPLSIFHNRQEKRWFYALQNGVMIGLLTVNKVAACNGWILNMLICKPNAVNSTSAFILMQAFEQLRSEGCTFFSVGFIPDYELGKTQGFNKPTAWILRSTYKLLNKSLKLNSKKQFWNQFEPTLKPSYLLCSSPWSIRDLKALLQALHVL